MPARPARQAPPGSCPCVRRRQAWVSRSRPQARRPSRHPRAPRSNPTRTPSSRRKRRRRSRPRSSRRLRGSCSNRR
jgi:hypothetical protein